MGDLVIVGLFAALCVWICWQAWKSGEKWW